jgi:hypothetical protein
VVGWYGGSEEYALISRLRFSRETFRKQRLQAPISVTPEPYREADRQMFLMAERREDLGLTLKSRHAGRIACKRFWQDLDGYIPG